LIFRGHWGRRSYPRQGSERRHRCRRRVPVASRSSARLQVRAAEPVPCRGPPLRPARRGDAQRRAPVGVLRYHRVLRQAL